MHLTPRTSLGHTTTGYTSLPVEAEGRAFTAPHDFRIAANIEPRQLRAPLASTLAIAITVVVRCRGQAPFPARYASDTCRILGSFIIFILCLRRVDKLCRTWPHKTREIELPLSVNGTLLRFGFCNHSCQIMLTYCLGTAFIHPRPQRYFSVPHVDSDTGPGS
jgi:hypothetical protein